MSVWHRLRKATVEHREPNDMRSRSAAPRVLTSLWVGAALSIAIATTVGASLSETQPSRLRRQDSIGASLPKSSFERALAAGAPAVARVTVFGSSARGRPSPPIYLGRARQAQQTVTALLLMMILEARSESHPLSTEGEAPDTMSGADSVRCARECSWHIHE